MTPSKTPKPTIKQSWQSNHLKALITLNAK